MGVDYLLRRRGPMTMAPSQLGAFTRSDTTRDRANIQYHVQPLSLDKFGEPLHPFPALHRERHQCAADQPRFLTLKSADPAQAPAIQPNYLATPEDRRVAADSIRVTRKIVAQPALQKYAPVEYLPGMPVRDDDEAALEIPPAISAPRFSTRSAPPAWAATKTPRGGRCAAARDRHRRLAGD